jgi:hypothetical protein
MLNIFNIIINKILSFGNFRITEIKPKVYAELLTVFENLKRIDTVFIPELIKLCTNRKGILIVDDSDNPKYGMKYICRIMKNLKTNGYHSGFKIVLFLWQEGEYRIPIGFGLWHKESGSLCDLMLAGLSRLRNEFKLKPKVVLADGAYCANKVVKRLTDYGIAIVFRWKSNRKLSNQQIKIRIPRGYGSSIGELKNHTKVKIFRRRNRFFETNRMLFEMQDIVRLYKIRWKIEETFRVLKSQIGINRCQQHSIKAQEIFLWMCMITFSCLERMRLIFGGSIYKAKSNVIFQNVTLDNSILKEVLAMN